MKTPLLIILALTLTSCGPSGTAFMSGFLRGTAPNRVQLTTDGHKPYLEAVEGAFGAEIDYATLVKIYGAERAGEARYSPAKCIGTRRAGITGNPDPKHISTSYIERSNLTLRLMNRRFTRLTLGFSKKIENHIHAIALFAFHYNFCKIHKTLRVTPAMEAGLTDHVWELDELVELLEEKEKGEGIRLSITKLFLEEGKNDRLRSAEKDI